MCMVVRFECSESEPLVPVAGVHVGIGVPVVGIVVAGVVAGVLLPGVWAEVRARWVAVAGVETKGSGDVVIARSCPEVEVEPELGVAVGPEVVFEPGIVTELVVVPVPEVVEVAPVSGVAVGFEVEAGPAAEAGLGVGFGSGW